MMIDTYFPVISLPMRNWNPEEEQPTQLQMFVISLPMRNWNNDFPVVDEEYVLGY